MVTGEPPTDPSVPNEGAKVQRKIMDRFDALMKEPPELPKTYRLVRILRFHPDPVHENAMTRIEPIIDTNYYEEGAYDIILSDDSRWIKLAVHPNVSHYLVGTEDSRQVYVQLEKMVKITEQIMGSMETESTVLVLMGYRTYISSHESDKSGTEVLQGLEPYFLPPVYEDDEMLARISSSWEYGSPQLSSRRYYVDTYSSPYGLGRIWRDSTIDLTFSDKEVLDRGGSEVMGVTQLLNWTHKNAQPTSYPPALVARLAWVGSLRWFAKRETENRYPCMFELLLTDGKSTVRLFIWSASCRLYLSRLQPGQLVMIFDYRIRRQKKNTAPLLNSSSSLDHFWTVNQEFELTINPLSRGSTRPSGQMRLLNELQCPLPSRIPAIPLRLLGAATETQLSVARLLPSQVQFDLIARVVWVSSKEIWRSSIKPTDHSPLGREWTHRCFIRLCEPDVDWKRTWDTDSILLYLTYTSHTQPLFENLKPGSCVLLTSLCSVSVRGNSHSSPYYYLQSTEGTHGFILDDQVVLPGGFYAVDTVVLDRFGEWLPSVTVDHAPTNSLVNTAIIRPDTMALMMSIYPQSSKVGMGARLRLLTPVESRLTFMSGFLTGAKLLSRSANEMGPAALKNASRLNLWKARLASVENGTMHSIGPYYGEWCVLDDQSLAFHMQLMLTDPDGDHSYRCEHIFPCPQYCEEGLTQFPESCAELDLLAFMEELAFTKVLDVSGLTLLYNEPVQNRLESLLLLLKNRLLHFAVLNPPASDIRSRRSVKIVQIFPVSP